MSDLVVRGRRVLHCPRIDQHHLENPRCARERQRFIDSEAAAGPVPAAGTIEIDTAGGHRLRISGAYDPEALARLIRGLSG